MKVNVTATIDYEVLKGYEAVRINTRSEDITQMMRQKIKENEKKAAKKSK